jgi:hypothetical protein
MIRAGKSKEQEEPENRTAGAFFCFLKTMSVKPHGAFESE